MIDQDFFDGQSKDVQRAMVRADDIIHDEEFGYPLDAVIVEAKWGSALTDTEELALINWARESQEMRQRSLGRVWARLNAILSPPNTIQLQNSNITTQGEQ